MTKKNKVVLALMVLLGLGIMLFSLRKVSLVALVASFDDLKWGWLLVAFGVMFLSLAFEATVVWLLVRKNHPAYPWLSALRVPLIEQLFNGITPFATGGQPAQIFALAQSGVDVGRASSAMILKFIVYQAMIVVNFIICLVLGFELVAAKVHVLVWFLVFGFLIHLGVIVGLLMVMFWYDFTKKIVHLTLWPVKAWGHNSEKYARLCQVWDEKLASFYEEGQLLKRNKKLLWQMSGLTLVQLALYYAIPYFILLSLGIDHANLVTVMVLHVLIVMVISLFPIPGGTGGAEYSFSMIFATFISQAPKLVLAMLLWRFVTYYFGMTLGIMALMISPQKSPTEKNSEKR